MALPKTRQSKSRSRSRYANWKLEPKNLTECPNCREYKENHKVCPACGYYDGKPVVVQDKKEK